MLTIIRKNQQVLMTIVVILTIVSFIWLYNRTNLDKVGSNDAFSIYGRVIQRAEVDRLVRSYQLAFNLGLTDFLAELGGMEADENASLNNYILNILIAKHQAVEMGIEPSDDAVATAIKGLVPFQTESAFDPAKYASFIQQRLSPNGLTERDLEDLVRNSLRVSSLYRVVTSPVAVSESELKTSARIYQPVTAQVIRFNREKFEHGIAVPQEEIAAFYEKNKAGLHQGETRSIAYASLELPEEQQALSGKERMEALQKLADKVVSAGKEIRAGVVSGGDFTKLAEKASLSVDKAASLERDGTQNGKDSEVPAAVVAGAFRLQKNGEVSDIIQDGDSFYIVTVEGITAPRVLALAEVSEKITTFLRAQKAEKTLVEAANKTLAQIQSALKAGKSFDEAVKAAGETSEPLNGISPADTKATQEESALAAATLSLKEGELGPLQPAPWGAFTIYLQKRTPLTDAQWKEHREDLSKKLLEKSQTILFGDWLNQARAASQFKVLGNR